MKTEREVKILINQKIDTYIELKRDLDQKKTLSFLNPELIGYQVRTCEKLLIEIAALKEIL